MAWYSACKALAEKCENQFCDNLDCGFRHTFKYCYDYQNTECRNNECLFLHCTSVEQLRYETTAKCTENLKREVARTLQFPNICGDFKTDECKRRNCRRRHLKFAAVESLECCICRNNMTTETLGASNCGHLFCLNCALRMLREDATINMKMKIKCSLCRCITEYIKFM